MTGCVTSSRPRAGQKGRNVQRGRRSRGHVIDENVCADVSTLPGPCSPEKMTTWMPNGQVLECHMNTRWPDHLNTGQMGAILFSFVLVRYSNGPSST